MDEVSSPSCPISVLLESGSVPLCMRERPKRLSYPPASRRLHVEYGNAPGCAIFRTGDSRSLIRKDSEICASEGIIGKLPRLVNGIAGRDCWGAPDFLEANGRQEGKPGREALRAQRARPQKGQNRKSVSMAPPQSGQVRGLLSASGYPPPC